MDAASYRLHEQALRVFPGGVNSPVRASVKPYPFYVSRAEGPYIYTVDGDRLIDHVLGYGPLILGHRHPRVLVAVEEQLGRGWLYGAPTEAALRLARKVLQHYPSADMIRFVNTGTEATMLAIRLARAFTGRALIVKFEGCYHGAHDYLLVGAGSAASHYGVPRSEGIPRCVAERTIVSRFNDEETICGIMEKLGERIAAVIVEPVMGNYGLIPPEKGFLEALRSLTRSHGSILIFDEVITGFRLSLGGAQEYYGVRADLTTLGKIIGGGFPIGAVLGPRKIMEMLTPSGRVFNAGTFNANPVSMVAGLATIEVLEEGDAYRISSRGSKTIAEAMEDQASRRGLKHWVNRVESMMQIFFTEGPVRDHRSASRSNRQMYEKLHSLLLKRGVFIPPSQFEVVFSSAVHTEEVMDRVVEAVEDSFREM